MKRLTLIVTAMVMTIFVVGARADLTISYTEDGSPAEFSVNPGETIDIPLYVLQTGDSRMLHEQGLFSVGVKIAADSAEFAALTAASLAPHWNGPLNEVALDTVAGTAMLSGSTGFSGPPVIFAQENSHSVLIGTIAVEGVAPGQTLLRAMDPDAISDSIFDGDYGAWDEVIFASESFATINTVPEPGTLALGVIGLITVAAVGMVRRRR